MEKGLCCGFLKPLFLLSTNACLLYKTSKIVIKPFIFTIYYIGIQRVIKGLQGATGGYKGLQVVTAGYKGLQGITGGYKWLQGVAEGDKGL